MSNFDRLIAKEASQLIRGGVAESSLDAKNLLLIAENVDFLNLAIRRYR